MATPQRRGTSGLADASRRGRGARGRPGEFAPRRSSAERCRSSVDRAIDDNGGSQAVKPALGATARGGDGDARPRSTRDTF